MHIPLHINPRSVSCRDQEAPRREAHERNPVYDVNFRRYLSVAEDVRGSDHCPASVFDEGQRCPGGCQYQNNLPLASRVHADQRGEISCPRAVHEDSEDGLDRNREFFNMGTAL